MRLPRRIVGVLLALALLAGTLGLPARTAVAAPAVLAPDADLLASQLAAVPKKYVKSSAWAVYTATGKKLVTKDKAMVPASTTKIFTAMAALDLLGASKTFTTKVVSTTTGKLTLVGGGDPYLVSKKSTVPAKKANLEDLAAATAAALAQSGVTKVTLTYSAPLFSGPSYSSSWKQSWSSYTARIMSLSVNSGMTGSKAYKNPAASTTKLFAKKLEALGLTVTYKGATSLPKGATTVAAVKSAPLGVIVQRMLEVSDNVAAETLARHLARKTGRTPSFAGGSATITAWLKKQKLWGKGMTIDGGSGLSSKTRVLPSVLARTVARALAKETFADLVTGLPVAGVNGTLKNRFNDPQEKAGRNVVHAKTGSLKGVGALAGYVTTADGTLVTFAFMATHDGVHQTATGNWLDRVASVLAACGCSLTS